jgi:predicted Zn-dependent peptidase
MRKTLLLAGLAILILASGLAAQSEIQLPVNQFTLANGMTFLVMERPFAPIFTGFISVNSGSAYEVRGNIGTAHLLEHMMFKGSQTIGTNNYQAEAELMPKEDSVWAKIDEARQQTVYIQLNTPEKLEAHLKYIESLEKVLDSLSQVSSQYVVQNEFDEIYTRNGAGEFNAMTSYDRTQYYVSLPANRLELWMVMESDRLKHPAFREFYTERSVVSEERRLSVENNPESKLFEQLIGTAFIAHPYSIYWEWQSEVNNLKRSDLEKFFQTYYIPQRMVVGIVGDVKTAEVKKLAEKYFGTIPAGVMPEPIYTIEPDQPGERRVDVEFDASPTVYIAYHCPAYDSPDISTFKVMDRALSDGRTSRLYKSLVLDKQICLDISASFFPSEGELGTEASNIYVISAYPKEGVTSADLEKAIYEELAKLSATPIEEKELTKIKNRLDAEFIWNLYSNLGMAWRLASIQNQTKDWHYLNKFRQKLNAVTTQDIMNVAQKYLTRENRTVATLIPKPIGGAQ